MSTTSKKRTPIIASVASVSTITALLWIIKAPDHNTDWIEQSKICAPIKKDILNDYASDPKKTITEFQNKGGKFTLTIHSYIPESAKKMGFLPLEIPNTVITNNTISAQDFNTYVLQTKSMILTANFSIAVNGDTCWFNTQAPLTISSNQTYLTLKSH